MPTHLGNRQLRGISIHGICLAWGSPLLRRLPKHLNKRKDSQTSNSCATLFGESSGRVRLPTAQRLLPSRSFSKQFSAGLMPTNVINFRLDRHLKARGKHAGELKGCQKPVKLDGHPERLGRLTPSSKLPPLYPDILERYPTIEIELGILGAPKITRLAMSAPMRPPGHDI